ncbi:Rcs stress response system protein RcsF [Erwinia sorbitola]|uniref:Rcs stress response system protein RcsF n=1 Tax=Erwinia sorbitola TaxID=2681984 RepID=A0A6I6EPZ4_9GAMM|nr:Rcs stress response system protein RcsF [Erwinia sorbitola]MTD27264.1 Rcs stress response system protein RcsF [Erwinia sorbitola]QGU88811.1 Rcs stress response system protein RcsF [Erwinia sorbitola]
MRKLVFILVSLALTGCANTADKSVQKAAPAKKEAPNSALVVKSPSSVQLLSNTDELGGKSFLALGVVSGSACQAKATDFPTDMNVVRRQMQANAMPLNADAVLLNNCEIITNTQSCYRQTLCKGSALRVAQ